MNSKQIIKCLLLAGTLAISLFACTNDTIIKPKVTVPDSISFKLNVIPIFNTSCNTSIGCHAKGGKTPDLSEANAYNNLMLYNLINTDVPEESDLYIKITTGTMKVHATDQDRAIILEWIKQGALDN
jgi:hypothetical protein